MRGRTVQRAPLLASDRQHPLIPSRSHPQPHLKPLLVQTVSGSSLALNVMSRLLVQPQVLQHIAHRSLPSQLSSDHAPLEVVLWTRVDWTLWGLLMNCPEGLRTTSLQSNTCPHIAAASNGSQDTLDRTHELLTHLHRPPGTPHSAPRLRSPH